MLWPAMQAQAKFAVIPHLSAEARCTYMLTRMSERERAAYNESLLIDESEGLTRSCPAGSTRSCLLTATRGPCVGHRFTLGLPLPTRKRLGRWRPRTRSVPA